MRATLKKLLAEYGRVAVITYLVIFALVLAGFCIAIASGFEPEGVSGSAGILGAAWLATKVTQPLRIAATILFTPGVAWILHRIPGRRGAVVRDLDPRA